MKKLRTKIKSLAAKMPPPNWGYIAFLYLVFKDDKGAELLFWIAMAVYSTLRLIQLYSEEKPTTFSTKIRVDGDLITVKVTGTIDNQEVASRVIDALNEYKHLRP